MNIKVVFVLLGLLLISANAFAFDIKGDISSWQKDDFIGFDQIGDCNASFGDISSLFARIENDQLFVRITFDDMVQRENNIVVKDNFQNKNISAQVSLYAGKDKKLIDQFSLPIDSQSLKMSDHKMLRNPSSNLLEISAKLNESYTKEDFTYRIDVFLDDVMLDTFIGRGDRGFRGGNCAFVHHGNQGLTYTEVFYGQDPQETSGFDEVLEVHEATNIPGNFHMSGTLMPAAEWHNPEFNDWLETGASEGWVSMMTSALGQHIMPFVQNDMNNWSVSIECDMVDFRYNYVPRIAWIPERVWCNPGQYPDAGVIDWLGDNWEQFDVDAVVLDDSPHCWSVNKNKIHWMNNGSSVNLRVIPIDNEFVGKMHYDADGAKTYINSQGQYEIAVYGTDWEVAAEMNEHYNTFFLDNYESVIWYCHDNYPAINVWKLDSALANADFNGSGFDITPGTYGLLGGGDGYGGSNNSWYTQWAAAESHSDYHSPKWTYGYIWDDVYNNIITCPDNGLSQLTWYTLMINLHETGWHTSGEIVDWEHRYSAHMKNANVYAEASRWANGDYTETTASFMSDIDRDGVDELIMHNDKALFVFETIGGKANWIFIKDDSGNGYSVVGSDVAYWSETDGDYNESSNNHVAALSEASPNYQHDLYAMVINTGVGDSVNATLSKNEVSKVISLKTGDSHLTVEYNFGNETGYVKSGWTPDLLDLIWSGKSHLQRMWGDWGEYCGQRNSASGATAAIVIGDAGAEFNTEFEGTLVKGDEIKSEGSFVVYLYAGFTSDPYDPYNNKVVELDDLADELQDTYPPQIVNAEAYLVSENMLQLVYNEPVDQATAIDPANYSFQNFTGSYTISEVILSHIRKVTIHINETFQAGDYGDVVVSNVEDLNGNVIDPAHNTGAVTDIIIPHVVGSMNSWTPSNHDYDLTLMDNGIWQVEMSLAAGVHEYKIIESNAWDGNDWPSENQSFTLGAPATVTIFANCGIQVGEQDYDEFVFHSPNPPVVVGNFLSEIGGTDWNEQTALTQMNDDGIDGDDITDDGIYTWFGSIPSGNYEYKIVLNNNWDQNTTWDNLFLNLDYNYDVYFYYDMSQNEISSFNAGVSIDDPQQHEPAINLSLSHLYPSPFNDQVVIHYLAQKPTTIDLEVFNIKGQKIITLAKDEPVSGSNTLTWNGCTASGTKVPSGIYLIQLSNTLESRIQKVVFLHK